MTPENKLKTLRERAEKALGQLGSDKALSKDANSEFKKLLQELQVHQIELEMQNEELRRVQKLLEEEKTKYSHLFEYASVGYVLMDINGVISDANQAFCKMTGQTKSALTQTKLQKLVMPGSQDELHFHLMNPPEKNETSSCILALMTTEGQTIWVQLESKTFFSGQDPKPHLQASVIDITRTKRSEEHLLRLSTAFEQSANSIIITDIQGNIQYANPVFFEKTGYSEEEAIGQNPRIIKHDQSKIDYHQMWQTISSGRTWKGEFLNKTKHGKSFWEIATITPVKNADNEIINYLAIKEDITQRKLAEQKLQKAKDFYLNLLEDFPVIVWQCDTRGNFNFYNKTLLDFTGADLYAQSPHAYIDQIHPKDQQVFRDAFYRSLEGQSHFVVEYRLKDRYQNYRWVLNHAKPFTNMDGEYGGFIATCIDIHDRRIMEERLIESEDKYRRMFEDSSLGIFKLDRCFSFVSANKSFAEMFGYDNSVDFLIEINNNPEKFFPDYGKEKSFTKELVKSRDNLFVVEKELYKNDGTKIYTVIHLRKVYERSRNKQFYIEGFIEDITQKKMAEKRLMLSEQKFKALFEKSYDAVVILDDKRIIDCNRKASELFDLPRPQLIGKTYTDLCPLTQYHDQETLKMVEAKSELALLGQPQNFDCLLTRGKQVFDAEVSFARIYVQNTYMVQAIVRDVSAKKQAEKQLKQAKEDAERARAAQSEFLSLMSHEIRTPLNAVVSLTDLMLHEEQNPEQEESLQSVKISARHLLGLIDDILDYNKIESGNIQFETTAFDIRELVKQLSKALGVKANEKNIEFRTHVSSGVPQILKGDTLRLKQILFNMLSNAIKFTDHGYVSLEVDAESRTPEGQRIYFKVADTGIGITEDRLEAIFEKFMQAETSTTRKYGGSGLGLTICKRLVEMQGGAVSASSKVGEGSVFTFYIPMETSHDVVAAEKDVPTKEPEYSLHGMRILLIEDDKMNQFVADKIIRKKWKAQLTICSSGEQALEKLGTDSFDLILLDLLLPAMDGYEVAHKIRNDKTLSLKNPRIPIIALTADAFLETRQKALEHGMNDFISKPFDYANLFETLNRYRKESSE